MPPGACVVAACSSWSASARVCGFHTNANTAHIQVVFVSSLYGLAEGAMIASRLGAVGYLTKPVESRDLVNVINLAICKRDLQLQRSARAAQSA